MAEPKDHQIRIEYELDGERYLEDFWTTETVAHDLIHCFPESKEFQAALKKLNPQMRYRQGYPAKDWTYQIKPEDVVGIPEMAGYKEITQPGQDRLFGRAAIKKSCHYYKAPLNLPAKVKKPVQEERLFED